ncbi:MAG TPA: hypothetical protein PLE30_02240 [Candidatus Kapabacteria bacterium]|nr:hypothetical protein [Candidatus Kapabacteria bacterium]
MKNILLLISIVALIASCSSQQVQRDDAVRIKKGIESKYNSNPNLPIIRNGNTLRGEVLKIQVEIKPDSCPINEFTHFTTTPYLLFIDSSVKNTRKIETIPLSDIDLIGSKLDIPKNKYNNINYFETYNNPLLPLEIREVPVDTVVLDCDPTPCPCSEVNIAVPCLTCIDCPERTMTNLFLSFKAGLAFYDDTDKYGNLSSREDALLDVAVGYRWGQSKRYALGLIYSSGVQTMNMYDTSLVLRSALNLYGRYDLLRTRREKAEENISKIKLSPNIIYDTVYTYNKELDQNIMTIVTKVNTDYNAIIKELENVELIEERSCFNPFIYGLLGLSIDKLSIDLLNINLNKDCQDQIPNLPNIDFSLPLNYGFGIGVEYPLSRYLDLSADIGFRSIAYANNIISSGMILPINQRTNSIVFRIGLVY